MCIRIAKILLGLFREYLDFHYHCISGIHDPHSSFEVVKSYQKNRFGAVAATREEVNSLGTASYTGFSFTPPPMVAGTGFVDGVKLDALNLLLIEKEEAYSIFIKNVVKRLLKTLLTIELLVKTKTEKNLTSWFRSIKKTV